MCEPKTTKTRVSDQDFVKAYLACQTNDELAHVTGLAKASVASRAGKLRKAGVKLVKYARSKKTTDVEALNDLIPSS